jgi:hypothetical protein
MQQVGDGDILGQGNPFGGIGIFKVVFHKG